MEGAPFVPGRRLSVTDPGGDGNCIPGWRDVDDFAPLVAELARTSSAEGWAELAPASGAAARGIAGLLDTVLHHVAGVSFDAHRLKRGGADEGHQRNAEPAGWSARARNARILLHSAACWLKRRATKCHDAHQSRYLGSARYSAGYGLLVGMLSRNARPNCSRGRCLRSHTVTPSGCLARCVRPSQSKRQIGCAVDDVWRSGRVWLSVSTFRRFIKRDVVADGTARASWFGKAKCETACG